MVASKKDYEQITKHRNNNHELRRNNTMKVKKNETHNTKQAQAQVLNNENKNNEHAQITHAQIIKTSRPQKAMSRL